MRLEELWKWEGTIGRGGFAAIGFLGFALKHNLDRLLATVVFGREWGIFNYWIPPERAVRITALPPGEAWFLLTMVLFSLPFVWIGVTLTAKRLRSAGLPLWLVAFFFAPFINLLFFLLLCVLPERAAMPPARPRGAVGNFLGRLIPDHPMGSAALASGLAAIAGLPAATVALFWFTDYGWGLFVALPFCMGLTAVLLHSYHRPRRAGESVVVSLVSVLLFTTVLLAVAWEGIVCLAMAAPLGIGLALAGGAVGHAIQRRAWQAAYAHGALVLLLLGLPLLMGAERAIRPEAEELEVLTVMEADAPPEVVWQNVVAFTQLAEPEEWLFRAGIAYPVRAEIIGQGVGAERHCVFSTGAFVEPIEVWDEPRRLKFSVISNPAPMEEWTPYGHIEPAHLDGYFGSSGGQFHLVPLPGGRTRIEATTWYRNRIWPAAYWQVWSDAIIHRIHVRVLNHVKKASEQQSPR
jgi:uncharacterized membrane protein YhaH (DUF805 family)